MFMHLGIARAAHSDIDGSIEVLQNAIAGVPGLAPAHYNLGLSLNKAKRFEEALTAFRTTLEHDPKHADAWAELGQALVQSGTSENEALDAFDQALALNPDHVGALNQKAMVEFACGRTDEAFTLMQHAIAAAPQLPELYLNFGDCLLGFDAPGAIDAFEKALALDADFPDARAKLAAAFERVNRVDDARHEATEVLKTDDGSYLARLTLARCALREQKLSEARTLLEGLLEEELPPTDFSNVQKSLTLVLDRQGAYVEAFDAAARANACMLKDEPVSAQDHDLVYGPIKKNRHHITADVVATWTRDLVSDYQDPIFFVGFPRSGTTLMEQILKVHPSFVSGGENEWLRKTFETLPAELAADLTCLSDEDIERMRAEYWRQATLKHASSLDGGRLIDKMPLNILHLAFVRRIFPRAKVLVAVRDPRDCVLSAFTQPFHRSYAMDQFLTLDTSAKFYDAVMGLWLHYQDVLGLETLEYKYEDLVFSPRPIMESILSFLGEDWNEVVLHHNKLMGKSQTIATPSIRDVAEGVHTRALKRWLNYADQLAPVEETLHPYLQHYGYLD